MELSHNFNVPAPVEDTWAAFNDVKSIAGCFPGANVTEVEGDSFAGSVKVKLGPIALVYSGSGRFIEKDEAAHRLMGKARGKDRRGNGTAGATVTATLTANGDSTDVAVLTDVAITGKPAQFGRGVLQDVSDKLLGQFVACLERKLAGGAAERPVAEPAPEPPAETAAAKVAEPVAKPAPEPVPEPAAEPVAKPAPEPVPEPAPEPVAKPAPEPAAEPVAKQPAAVSSESVTAASTAGSQAPQPPLPPPTTAPKSTGGRSRSVTAPPPAGSQAPQPPPATAPPRSEPGSASRPKPDTAPDDDALDLGSTVIPVLARTYWRQAAAALAVLLAALLFRKLRNRGS